MSGNTFGRSFCVTTFGESHGVGVGCVIDGCPPGHLLDKDELQAALRRRKPGQSKLTTARDEDDLVEILSGISEEDGRTLGTPICMLVRNKDARSSSYGEWHHIYRPSHADFTYDAKYGVRAWQGGGRASARETVGRVAAGALAEQLLRAQVFRPRRSPRGSRRVHSIDARSRIEFASVTRDLVEAHPTRCPDPESARAMEGAILDAKKRGDSLGGYVRLRGRRNPSGARRTGVRQARRGAGPGLYEPPRVQGGRVRFWLRWARHQRTRAQRHLRVARRRRTGRRGEEGARRACTPRPIARGASKGASPTVCRSTFVWCSSQRRPCSNRSRAPMTPATTSSCKPKGGTTPAYFPRAVPIVEAMTALVIVDAWLRQRGQVGDPWPGLKGPLRRS